MEDSSRWPRQREAILSPSNSFHADGCRVERGGHGVDLFLMEGTAGKPQAQRERQVLHRTHYLRGGSAAARVARFSHMGEEGIHRRAVGIEKCPASRVISCSFLAFSPVLTVT